jgi:hypothetical protein
MFVGSQPFFNDAVTAVVQVKAGAGFVYALKLVNTTGLTAYLQLFDRVAASVTLGTTAPKMVFRLAANESVTIPLLAPMALGQAINDGTGGISLAGTTTPGGNTTAAISVSAVYQ